MVSNESILTLDDQSHRKNMQIVRLCCTISLIGGIWLFVSPWVYGSEHVLNSWNSWLIGGLIVACVWLRLAFPARMPGLSWFTAFLGAYVFASPWLYGYIGDTGRWVNCMLVGIPVALSSIIGGAATEGTPNQNTAPRQI